MRIVVERLADLGNLTLVAHCPNLKCMHRAQLDTGALMLRFGENTLLDTVQAKLRCQKCGRRPCKLHMGSPDVGGGYSAY